MSYTNDFPFIKGQFHFANQQTPYFCVVVSVSEAIQVFRLARETIMDPTSVSLDELFQRQVNRKRVKAELVPYLTRPGTMKFFGSLIVALLPFEGGKLGDQFDKQGGIEFSPEKDAYVSTVGPIRITTSTESSGTISWDLSKVAAVVIDGQHRFSAIRALAESDVVAKDQEVANTTLPITLLVLDRRVGYEGEDARILQAVRRVFVDLNRHAEPVSEARSILLDDCDLTCVLTKELFGRSAGARAPGSDKDVLPLAVVDWYTEKAKFDTGIHLTTVLCLHSLVKDFLALPPTDTEDPEQCTRLIERICILLPNTQSEPVRRQLEQALRDATTAGQSFSIGAESLDVLRQWFRETWVPALTSVLKEVKCYQEYLGLMKQADILEGRHEVWAALDESGKAAYEQEQGFQPGMSC